MNDCARVVIQMAKNSQHVVSNPSGGWSVKREGAVRASRTFPTQGEAVAYGIHVIQKIKGELVIHRKDGTILSKNGYGNVPCLSEFQGKTLL